VAGRDQGVSGKHCYHCKQWIEEGQAHDCWTTTEAALTRDLAEDLREAYQRIRETAAAFGDQRIYASLNSIMFSRKACYLFVRPKKTYLEVCVFLGRPLNSPQVRRAEPASKTKFANLLRIQHRDEVEAPITDWMQEAYERSDELSAAGRRTAGKKTATGTKKKKRRVSSRSASSARNRRR
jgi:hypothetical protein